MEFEIINPDAKRIEKREARIRKALNKIPHSMLKGELKTRESVALRMIKESQDEETPSRPGLMVNTVLWDAYVENLIIARKLQAEIK